MKLIELYKEWMETGLLPNTGLCFSLPIKYIKYLKLCEPITDENISGEFWACPELEYGHPNRESLFSETRQTIVLLICAMCDEL